jgi:ABC-2 type transport system permease protein
MTTPPSRHRDLSRPLPLVAGARSIAALSIEGMIWSRRSLVMAWLIGLPVVFALLYRAVLVAKLPARMTGFDLYGAIVAFYLVRNVLPLAALFYATSLIADEVEGKTLTYLVTRPVTRASILVGKFAAYLATTLTLALPTVLVSFFLLVTAPGAGGVSARVGDLLQDMAVAALALAVYGALFTLVGVLLRRPVIPGLLFLFVWELLANAPGDLPKLTLSAYVRSLISHRPVGEGFSAAVGQVLPTALSLEVVLTLTLLFLAGSLALFSKREYVLEQ